MPRYNTTTGLSMPLEGVHTPPEAPDADARWQLVSSAAVVSVIPGRIHLYWFWRLDDATTPCSCRALARKAGKCLACGKAVS